MTDSHAEQLDPTVLGEEVGDDRRPGDDFPPEEPLGIDDPSIVADGRIARDDVESRRDRLVPEAHADRSAPATGAAARIGGLVDPAAPVGTQPRVDDEEQQLVATESPGEEGGPEADAMYRTSDLS